MGGVAFLYLIRFLVVLQQKVSTNFSFHLKLSIHSLKIVRCSIVISNNTNHMQILLLFFLFFVLCTAIQLEDEITVRQEDGRNVTHSLVNEVYTFKLIPTYYVPARILRHTIWTTSQEQNKEEVKRHLERRKRGEHHPYLSPVQLQELRDIIEESSSSHQQRSIPDEGLENTLGSHSNLRYFYLATIIFI